MKKHTLHLFLIILIVSGLQLSGSSQGTSEGICGADDLYNAICYQSTEPDVYNKSKAIVRLKIGLKFNFDLQEFTPIDVATGFLVGNEGHILTVHHAFDHILEDPNYTEEFLAENTIVEIMAEGDNCDLNCREFFACPGIEIATETEKVVSNESLDYMLLKLPADVVDELEDYGYLTINSTGATVGEQVYIPQHPQGWGKQISYESDNENDPGGVIHVQSIENTGRQIVRYFGDTFKGGSGSPVISYENHCVVALQTHDGCPKLSSNMNVIAGSLASYLPPSAYDCGNCGTGVDTYITSNVDYNNPLDIKGNIIIEPGGHLTVNSSIYFGEFKKLIVKPGGSLTIDGGTLSKCSNADFWQGVVIEGIENTGLGSPTGGSVIIKNGGSIEYAKTGVKKVNQITNPMPGGGSSLIHSNVGNLELSTNATIRNCDVGVELNSTGGSSFAGSGLEMSTINNAFIENNAIGVLLRGNRGLIVNESTFTDNYYGVEIKNSFIEITKNDFIDQQIGVFINADYPVLMGSNIIENTFTGSPFNGSFSIYSESLNNAEYLNISNNTMVNYDIYNLGLSTFDIRNNDFLNGYHAITSSATGSYIANYVRDNSFFNNEIGNNVDGINDIEYLRNCFDATNNADIGLGFASSINDFQGNEEFSAANCFDSNSRIQTSEINSPSTSFKYYTKEGANSSPINCKNPGQGNFTIEDSDNEDSADDCGSGSLLFGDLPPRYRDCEEFLNQNNGGDIADFINALEDEIDRINALIHGEHLSNAVGQILIAQYEECLDGAIKEEVIRILKSPNGTDREGAILFLSSRPEFRYQIMAYGLLIDNEEYTRARILLNSLSPIRSDEFDFIDVQNIHLNYLEDRNGYDLSQSDRDFVFNVGEKRLPLSGFARTVYYVLTGDRHFITVPSYNGTPINRSVKNESIESNVHIYPNPSLSNDVIHIDIKEILNQNNSYIIEVFDINGNIIKKSEGLSGVNEIHFDNNYNGLFFIRISNMGKTIFTDKVLRM